MAEPSTESFHQSTLGNQFITYFAATRPAFLTASVLPVFTALAYSWGQGGENNALLSLLIVVSLASIHSAANVLNDYFDSKNGTDAANEEHVYPFTGGSRFIQNQVLSEEQMLRFGLALLAAGIAGGLLIAVNSGPLLLPLGLLGVLLAYFYSAPPCLACRGLGDLTIAVSFGLLPVVGTVYVLQGRIDIHAVWIGLVIGCFVAAILWINSVPDIEADRRAGKNTLPVRLQKTLALRMHGLWFVTGFILIIVTPLVEAGMPALLASLPALFAAVSAWMGRVSLAIPATIVTHALVCLLLALGFLI